MNPEWMKNIPAEWEVKRDTQADTVRHNYRNQGRLLERKRIIEALQADGEFFHINQIIRIIEGKSKWEK